MIIRKKRTPFTGKYTWNIVSVDAMTDVERTEFVCKSFKEARSKLKELIEK